MTSPIKVGDIVRVVNVVGASLDYPGTHVVRVEPLTHGTLTDIESASVMLERAHHRIGELTRELAGAEVRADEIHRARMLDHAESMRVIAGLSTDRSREIDLRKAAERALAEAQRELAYAEALIDGRTDVVEPTREPTTHEKMMRPIGGMRPPFDADAYFGRELSVFPKAEQSREPNGYDPGARRVETAEVEGIPASGPVMMGQRWVWAGAPDDPSKDHVVQEVAGNVVFTESMSGSRFGTSLGDWGRHHPRLREPTATEKAADPHAWAVGTWAVNDSLQHGDEGHARRLRDRDWCGRLWLGVGVDGADGVVDVPYCRPATPEETSRFEAELASNTAPKVAGPTGVLGAAIAWAGCLAESIRGWHPQRTEREWMEETFDRANKAALRAKCGDLVDAWDLAAPFQDWLDAGAPETWPKAAPEPLKVGQRWVFGEALPWYDVRVEDIDPTTGDVLVTQDPAWFHGGPRWWAEADFRAQHPRLRLPEELEPAPAPPAEPKTSLPVVCGECEHRGRLAPGVPAKRATVPVCLHPERGVAWPLMSYEQEPPHACPLRPKLRQGEP
jgi:hypothetical protein